MIMDKVTYILTTYIAILIQDTFSAHFKLHTSKQFLFFLKKNKIKDSLTCNMENGTTAIDAVHPAGRI